MPPPFSLSFTAAERAIREGRAFRAYSQLILMQGAASLFYGSTGDKLVFMAGRSVFTDGGALLLTLLEAPVIVSDGAQVTVYNVNRNSNNMATLEIFNGNIEIFGGLELERAYVLGGGIHPALSRNETAWLLRQNTQYALRVENIGHSRAHVLFQWFWFEEE